MTAILGIREKGRVILASDGTSTMGSIKMSSTHSKIFQAKGSPNIYVALTGNAIANTALRYQPHLFADKKDLTYHYLVTQFVPWLNSFAVKSNAYLKKDDDEGMLFSLIIATKTKLFQINSRGVVIECQHIVARGSGSTVALYDLLAHDNNDLSPEEKAISAIKHAIAYSPGLGYPLIVVDPVTQKATVYDEKGNSCITDAKS